MSCRVSSAVSDASASVVALARPLAQAGAASRSSGRAKQSSINGARDHSAT